MKILFVGESWRGSSARSLREALSTLPNVSIDDVGEDHYFPSGRSLPERMMSRLMIRWFRASLALEIVSKLKAIAPDVLIVYKGSHVSKDVLAIADQARILTVNILPDYSPHAYGNRLRDAMGRYALVVSTKPFHPASWKSTYGFSNACVFVPHGYDPAVHLWSDAPHAHDVDVAIVATCRFEYEQLMLGLAKSLGSTAISVKIGGYGWTRLRDRLPEHWQIVGPIVGRGYGEFLRRARVVIAPVNREAVIDGVRQPGDEDSTRSYELAAAGCFFLHQRTPYVQQVYDESTEVPMWDNAGELAELIRQYLPDEGLRRAMAARAHARAVPAYSIPARAKQVMEHIEVAHRARARE